MSRSKSAKAAELGAVLRDARLAKGLSQAALAKLLGYGTPQLVSDWERGLAALPMKRLTEIAAILEMDRDTLFDLLLKYSVERMESEMRDEYRRLDSKRRRARS